MVIVLLMIVIIYVIFVAISSSIAYVQGRDDASQTYGWYSNTFWMPMAYWYNLGYTTYEGKAYVSLEERNKKRFNRE